MILLSEKAPSPQYLDGYLSRLDAESLKYIARTFGGNITWRKSRCLEYIQESLKIPERIEQALQRLQPIERNLMAFLKVLGGSANLEILQTALYASGMNIPFKQHDFYDPFHTLLNRIMKHGLMFNMNPYGMNIISSSYNQNDVLLSDYRILDLIAPPEIVPLDIQPVEVQAQTYQRAPNLVAMQTVGILQAIEVLHGLKPTKNGDIRVSDLRKLAKQLGWNDGALQDGNCIFRNALPALVQALQHIGVLGMEDLIIQPTEYARTFQTYSIEAQVRLLLNGMLQAPDWLEDGESRWAYHKSFQQGRLALYILLQALPDDQSSFYSIDDFDMVMFQRIGSIFSLYGRVFRPYTQGKDRKAAELEYVRWLAQQRENWLAKERHWLESALVSWLYFLGIVTLSFNGQGKLSGLRLTDLGRAVLHPTPTNGDETTETFDSWQPAWIVQPNFDVVVYMDQLTTAQLTFIERHAERKGTQEYVAEYRLTRDSVYQGLESGTLLEELLEGLQRGCSKELPQNVTVEIREWAALRDRVALRRAAKLAEFPSARAREKAVLAGVKGRPVGERYLLLTDELPKAQTRLFQQTVDYHRPLQRVINLEEDGCFTLQPQSHDLVLEGRLKAWAEEGMDGKFRFTAQSIQTAIEVGKSLPTLIKLLENRCVLMIPPFLRLALQAWGGEKVELEVARIVVLRSPSSEVSYAVQQSRALRAFIRQNLAPGIFLVDESKLSELRAFLSQFGIEVTDYKESTN